MFLRKICHEEFCNEIISDRVTLFALFVDAEVNEMINYNETSILLQKDFYNLR